MFRLVDRHPFIAGFLTGFVGVGMIGKGLKKLIGSKITIIQIDFDEIDDDTTSGKKQDKDKKEN